MPSWGTLRLLPDSVLMVAGCPDDGAACHILYVGQSVSVEAGNVRAVCVGPQEAVSAFSLAGGTIYR